MKIRVGNICSATGGSLVTGSDRQEVTSVAIDSRQVGPGALFVAFAGERTDGHKFLADCAARGAVAALVEGEAEAPEGLAVIRVGSTLRGIQDLARWYRRLFPQLRVVGITGSSGKTTTKELTFAALGGQFSILKSLGNQNNEIGLPLTMFSLSGDTEIAVLEMGMSDLGEIARLCEIAAPDIGLITNVGEAHIQRLGTKENVLMAKYELAQGLKRGGTLIYNGDDPLLRSRVIADKRDLNFISCGINFGNDFRAIDIQNGPEGSNFIICWRGLEQKIRLNMPGSHNVGNSILAFAAAISLGVPQEIVARGLASARAEKGRMQVFQDSGLTIIDDTYNANPSSMEAALRYLATLPGPRRLAFLGDMLELGELAPLKHRQIGALVAALNLDLLVAVGNFAEEVVEGARSGGMKPDKLLSFPDSTAATAATTKLLPEDLVLFKGSRGAKMEVLIDFIIDGGRE